MVYITDNSSSSILQRLGNEDGPHAGDLVVVLPGAGQLRAASADVTVCPEGVYGRSRDGRQFFVSNGGLVLIDAPALRQAAEPDYPASSA